MKTFLLEIIIFRALLGGLLATGSSTITENDILHYSDGDTRIEATLSVPHYVSAMLHLLQMNPFKVLSFSRFNALDQGWANYGPRAACGPREHSVRPANTF